MRCASTDRRPLVGEVEPGLWVSTAMGSRGLTFAALCGELLAARLHGEPLPLEHGWRRRWTPARQLGSPPEPGLIAGGLIRPARENRPQPAPLLAHMLIRIRREQKNSLDP